MPKSLYAIKENLSIVGNELKNVNDDLLNKVANPSISMEEIDKLQAKKDDLQKRFNLLKNEHDELEHEEKEKLNKLNGIGSAHNENDLVDAKAEFFKSVINNRSLDNKFLNTLGGFGAKSNGGEKLLPKTLSNTILTEPFIKNPLRNLSMFTSIQGLEIPKLLFDINDEDTTFLADDSEIAKEIATTGSSIEFGRNKIKVKVNVTDTLMHGTNTNLVQTIESGLQSALAYKEKAIAFAPTNINGCESFYNATDIKVIEGNDLLSAIIFALGDLDDLFSDNAQVTMKRSDYYSIIANLANGSTTLYMAQPSQVIGAPVEFCDKAVTPVVGDFQYSHFNYDPVAIYDRDKDVDTGIYKFVLTAWVDHKIKLKSAFRLAKVKEAGPLSKNK